MSSIRKSVQKAEAAVKAGDLAKAGQILAEVNAEPARRNLPSLLLHSHVLEAQRDIPQAIAALEIAETKAREPWEKVKILNKAADLLCGRPDAPQEDVQRAVALLEKSVALDARPGNAMSRKNLCALYYRLQLYDQVERHAMSLVDSPKYGMKANLWIAGSCFFLDSRERGEPYLLKAAEASRDLDASDFAWLLEMLMNYRQHSRAQQIIDQAVDGGRNDAALVRIQAQIHYETRAYDRVLDILPSDFVADAGQDARSRQFAHFMRGRAFDALGRYGEAHESFEAMNELARSNYPAPIAKDSAAAFMQVDPDSLPEYELPDTAPYVPTFMVAFPRSGTTLLDTILDTQDEVRTLSEVQGVLAASYSMTESGREYPEDLASLSRQELDRLRDVYFAYNERYLEPDASFKVLIDKVPLNILHIPFIRMLFPGARFIFSLRHPLDVCLSCFQQGFHLNDEMLHFTQLESTFVRYRDVMNTFQRFQDAGNLNLLTVRYEDLVDNFEATASGVFAFLDIEPNEDYKKFYEINQRKLSATPSRDQVVQPLYRSSRFRWQNYEAVLKPYIEIVQPFIDRFGYGADQ